MRIKFMKNIKLLLIVIILSSNITIQNRPDPNKRKFRCYEVDKYIEEVKSQFKNHDLAIIYENCFPNTLDTTVEYDPKSDDTFVITGDIEAMWLRDSSFQIFPYLSFAAKDNHLKNMMLSLINRHTKSILIDPYANAFNKEEADSPWQKDRTFKIVDGKRVFAMNRKIWERKYELDSPISTLFFAYNFYKNTNDLSFINPDWINALEKIVDLVKKQMKGTDEEHESKTGPEYFFQREGLEPFDSLHQGVGNPVNSCKLVKTAFRNSDDSVIFAYNIPENAFMVSTFEKVAEMIENFLKSHKFKINGLYNSRLKSLKNEILDISQIVKEAIYNHGVFVDQISQEKFFAYEVDCYGNFYFMDDPGYPSLISLPFFDFVKKDDQIYLNTRKRILSNKNPFYFSINNNGRLIEGLGSSHTERLFIWPLFNVMRILTSDDEIEIQNNLDLLINSAKSTGFMHESFYIKNYDIFTRKWFAWANSFFGYMINDLISRKSHLIIKLK